MNTAEILRQMHANGQAIRALLETIPEEQAQWKPGPEIWSLTEVMAHVYNEERVDFRKHLHEMLGTPPQPWGLIRSEDLVQVSDLRQALSGFLAERENSLAWLRGLNAPDWDARSDAPWGSISAGDVLVSWLEHDYLHLRQLNEVLHAWNVEQATPYSVQYAGGW